MVKAIKELLGPQVKVFDGAAGTARQLRRRLYSRGLLNGAERTGKIIWENSSEAPEMIELGKMLLGLKIE